MQTASERTAERLATLHEDSETFALALRVNARATRLLAVAALNESIRLLPILPDRAEEYATLGNSMLVQLREALDESS